jgi:addiction module HigA family antidote
MPEKMPPVHPGEILQEEFLDPMKISQYRLAVDTSVPPRRINEIVHGKRAITADTALRLSRYFGTSERFWLNLQTRYDLELQKDKLGNRMKLEVVIREKTADYLPVKNKTVLAGVAGAKAGRVRRSQNIGDGAKIMGNKKSKYSKAGIDILANDKSIVYRIKTASGKDNYIGTAKRYSGRERISEHLEEIPGATVEIKQFDNIKDARLSEDRLIKRNKPKYNKKGK